MVYKVAPAGSTAFATDQVIFNLFGFALLESCIVPNDLSQGLENLVRFAAYTQLL